MMAGGALVWAQDEKQQEDKPARQEEAKPQPKQDEAKPSKPDKQMQKEDEKRGQEQSHQQATPERQDHPEMQGDRERQGQEHPEMQDNRGHQGQAHPEQNAQNGHAAGRGGHIPDDKFHSHFGRGHSFRAQTVIVSGQPQFQYGGYTFELVDAWPADWAYTDDCYIDYVDGEYFLFDLLHPGVRIAVFVVM